MYAIYLRKSRADVELEAIGEGETLARHRQALTELARKKEIVVSKVYEEVVSGESIADRPQMQLLLDDVMLGKYKGILVMEIERLARGNTKDQGEVAEAFAMSKTLIITPSKTYDPTNEFDEEYFEFGLFMSRREYKTIRRRMQRGIIASVKEGNYVGSLPPYGYDIVRINKKERTLKPNEQSKYVEMMFNWFVNDRLNPGTIAKKLTYMGVPTKTGKQEWNRATIKDILKNDLYTGKIRWNRRKVSKEFEEGSVKKKKRRQLSSDYIIVDGKHPAIISEEMFEKAQSLFTGSVPIKANETIVNPLARLLFCKKCGKAIGYQGYNKRESTQPRYIHKESTLCKVKSSQAEEVIDILIQNLKLIVDDFEFKMTNEHIQNEINNSSKIIESLQKELKTCENKHKQIFDYLERNIYTEDEFLERKNVLNERISTLEKQLKDEMLKRPDKVDYKEDIIKFTEVIDSLKNPNIEMKRKNELLKDIITKIEYDCEDLGRFKGGKITLDIYLKP